MTYRILLRFNDKTYRARVDARTAREAKKKVLASVQFLEIKPEIPVNPFPDLLK